MKNFFISWSKSSFTSKVVSEFISEIIRDWTNAFVYHSKDKDALRVGENWLYSINNNLDICDFLLVVIDGSSTNSFSRYMFYELGYFSSKNKVSDDGKTHILPIVINLANQNEIYDLPILKNIQTIGINSEDDFTRFFRNIIHRIPSLSLKPSLDNKDFSEYADKKSEKLYNEIMLKLKNKVINSEIALTNSLSLLSRFLSTKSNNDPQIGVLNFICSKLILKNIEGISKISLNESYYPVVLSYIIKNFSHQEFGVRAVAVIGDRELFWKTAVGKSIIKQSIHTIRLFIFKDENTFDDNIDWVINSVEYHEQVRLVSLKQLLRTNHQVEDFSIIGAKNDTLLCYYTYPDGGNYGTQITFTTDENKIDDYSILFDSILKQSILISKDFDKKKRNIDEIRKSLFSVKKGVRHYRKNIEMSSYISIEDYDLYEEYHPFFKEMLDSIKKRIESSELNDKNIRILEIGCGTMHLTRRLAEISDCHIIGVEIDKEIVQYLKKKSDMYPDGKLEFVKQIASRNESSVKIINSNAINYNSKDKFDFIVSSFAEHHIKPHSKTAYFNNVYSLLKTGGSFIIGDEFLRQYDEDNYKDWLDSLNDYHKFIIKYAQQEALKASDPIISQRIKNFIPLEKDALLSGKNEIGDFKMGLDEYLAELMSTYFKDSEISYELIGPDEKTSKEVYGKSNVGGIFVIQSLKK
ncbi:MAG: class I SAM-dependent methyltransferase [Bacteroidota bacterium]